MRIIVVGNLFKKRSSGMYNLFGKRLIDFLLALFLIVILVAPAIFVAILVWRDVGFPVLFRQARAGWHGRTFELLKFRSMAYSRGEDGELLPDHCRLTAFGRFMRSTSFDEIPQLVNILKGDMSFIGPRPLLLDYLPLYNSHQIRRHEVRPGMSGWAQVNGRNSLPWEDKLRLDVWYVDKQSLMLDFRIVFLTLLKVLLREGINTSKDTSAIPFTGTGPRR